MYREAKNLMRTSHYDLLTATFGNVQVLLAENLMKWSDTDKACTDMFNGSHLATEILEGAPDYDLIAMENFQSVWLDSKAFNLGCRGKKSLFSILLCLFFKQKVEFIFIPYSTYISNQYVVGLCNIEIGISKHRQITSTQMKGYQ